MIGRINYHGVVVLVGIGVMFTIAHSKDWHVSWLYFVASVLFYLAATIRISLAKEAGTTRAGERFEQDRILIGMHFGFAFLAAGMWLDIDGFWANLGIYLASIIGGLAISYLLLTKNGTSIGR